MIAMCATNKLLKRIECLRKEMTNTAIEKGFTSSESLAMSQELDRLLNLYDTLRQKDINNK